MGSPRSRDTSDSWLGSVVLIVVIAFLVSNCDFDDSESAPAPRPAVTVTETIAPPDPPATKQEEEDEAKGKGGSDHDDFHGQTGIQFGYACSPVGAPGVAEDGRPAKCFMGKDGRARWGYDSNRG
jgi:hypothetical protein